MNRMEKRNRKSWKRFLYFVTRNIVSKNHEMLLHNIVISSIYVYTSISDKRDRDLERVFDLHAIFLTDHKVVT